MAVFSTVAYELTINLVGGVLSAVLVLWFTIWWQGRSAFRWQLIRLRNILHDAETYLDPLHRHRITDESWTFWSNQCEEIRYTLTELGERLTMYLYYRRNFVRVPRAVALNHFQLIGSVFAEQHPIPYLGVIECTTETRNLLNAARVAMERADEDEITNARQRISRHRQYIETLIERLRPNRANRASVVRPQAPAPTA